MVDFCISHLTQMPLNGATRYEQRIVTSISLLEAAAVYLGRTHSPGSEKPAADTHQNCTLAIIFSQ